MKEKKITITLIVLCTIAFLTGLLWAANYIGVIDIKEMFNNISYSVLLKNKTGEAGAQIPDISPIEKDNQELRASIKTLEEKIANLESEKTVQQKKVEEMQQELDGLRAYKAEQEKATINIEQMASYYKEMKPDVVAKIMNNLDDDTLLAILPLLDNEQVAKIMAVMEPQRAALITQLLIGSNSSENEKTDDCAR